MSRKPIFRTTETYYSDNGSSGKWDDTYIRSQPSYASILDGSYDHDCIHWKTTRPYNGPQHSDGSWPTANFPADVTFAIGAIEKAVEGAAVFNVGDFFGGFSIIETLKELDKIPALFNPQTYIGYSGYGAYKWGFKPFIDDVKNISQALRRYISSLANGKQSQPFSRTVNVSATIPENSYRGVITFKGTVRFSGEAVVDTSGVSTPLQHLLHLLDSFQFNPDILTAWEITPYSFVADYYIPVSDILGAVTTRGYLSYPVYLKGWTTIEGTYTFAGKFSSSQTYKGNSATYAEGSYYQRNKTNRLITAQPDVKRQPPFKGPSPQQLADTLYVLSQRLPNRK